jgi:heterodisulfide reductase subunit C
MHLAQLALQEEIEKQNTCWVCASCHTCNVRCPRGVDLPRIMEAIRLMTLRENRNMVEPSKMDKNLIRECPQIAMVAGFRKLTA